LISVVERIWTFSYFVPTILRLTATEDLPEAEVQAALSQWLLLDYGRHALTHLTFDNKSVTSTTAYDARQLETGEDGGQQWATNPPRTGG
jgi:hypothetical protein